MEIVNSSQMRAVLLYRTPNWFDNVSPIAQYFQELGEGTRQVAIGPHQK